jgi:hypothetical protein
MAKTKMSKQEWQEHLTAKVTAAQEVLAREIAAIQSGDDWRRFLDLQSKLHAYSANNVMLVWSQHIRAFAEGRVPTPEPTYVAGFRTWQALGRNVEKGQHGYAVLAPVRYKVREAVDAGGNRRRLGRDDRPREGEQENSRQAVRGFTIEHVFDASQTYGEPLPVPPSPQLLEGEAPKGLGEAVMRMLEADGWTVDTVPDATYIQGANGITVYSTRTVRVRADMDDAAMVKTLIHEAAHVLLHDGPPGNFLPRHRKEVEAESVAYVVAAAHGMATDDYTFPYVAGWAGTDPTKAVTDTQSRVAHAAKAILEISPSIHTPGGKVPGADLAVTAARKLRAGDVARRSEHVPAVSAVDQVGVA